MRPRWRTSPSAPATCLRIAKSPRGCRGEAATSSPHFRSILLIYEIGPLRIGRLGQIYSGRNADHPLQRSEYRVAAVPGGVWLCGGFGEATARCTGLDDPAKHQLARCHIYLRAFEAGIEPDLRHDVVGRVVAPPGAVMLRFRRQFYAGDFLYFAEGQRHLPQALLLKERTEIFVFTHSTDPV